MYPTADEARRAAEALLAGGAPAGEVRVVIGTPTRDVRREPVGSFQGTIAPEDPVGTFAGPSRPRSEAPGGWMGDRSRRRHGSFADSEHDQVVSFDGGGRRSRIVDRHGLIRLLDPIEVDEQQAGTLVRELHEGHAMLLVETS
jgi:hypothetical protein